MVSLFKKNVFSLNIWVEYLFLLFTSYVFISSSESNGIKLSSSDIGRFLGFIHDRYVTKSNFSPSPKVKVCTVKKSEAKWISFTALANPFNLNHLGSFWSSSFRTGSLSWRYRMVGSGLFSKKN